MPVYTYKCSKCGEKTDYRFNSFEETKEWIALCGKCNWEHKLELVKVNRFTFEMKK